MLKARHRRAFFVGGKLYKECPETGTFPWDSNKKRVEFAKPGRDPVFLCTGRTVWRALGIIYKRICSGPYDRQLCLAATSDRI